jgi:hypothetical protein
VSLTRQATSFSISIPFQAGSVAKPELMHFIEELRSANIKLLGLAGFAQGRRIRILLIAKDEDEGALRSFLRSQRLRARRGRVNFAQEPSTITPLGQIEQWATSGADLRTFADFPTSPTSGRGAGFIFVEEWID